MLDTIRQGLAKSHDKKLVDELLEAYVEAKKNFYLGGLRLSAVEGGRFCEAAFRILEAIRLHIPRALRVVYDIRNKRDAAHLADNIDPNLQDSSLVVYSLDWVLAEFVRLYHTVPANEAQSIVESLVMRRAPVVQDFAGFLKVLNPGLVAGDYALVLLYQCGKVGATFNELTSWSKPKMRANLKTTLTRLVDERAFAHFDGNRYFITESGMRDVEKRKLYQMPD
ncbi:MAG: hypothetical protein DMG36_26920 [Acidobacteria bacterium]|nr:MAG: hypothetical protein DMG36_26920 [Acidobacteriota bacterium]